MVSGSFEGNLCVLHERSISVFHSRIWSDECLKKTLLIALELTIISSSDLSIKFRALKHKYPLNESSTLAWQLKSAPALVSPLLYAHTYEYFGDAYSSCEHDGDLAVPATAAAPNTVSKKGPKQAKSAEDGEPLAIEGDGTFSPL